MYVKWFENLLPKAYNCADKWIKSCLTSFKYQSYQVLMWFEDIFRPADWNMITLDFWFNQL